jgi:hypothetical protein
MTTPILVKRSEIDIHLWDELIKNSEQRCVYGYSWYLDCVSPGWSAIVWPSLTDYAVVLPLPIVRKWGIQVVQQPFFCQYLGFFSKIELSKEVAQVFLEKINNQFIYISSYSFNPGNTPVISNLLPQVPDFISRLLATHWLSLTKTYPEIYNGYSKDKKENLRKSLKQNWKIEYSDNLEPLLKLFEANHADKITGGVASSAYQLFKKIYNELVIRKLDSLVYALQDANIHAGCLIVKEGKQHIYLFNAADRIGRKGNARAFLLDNHFQFNTNSAIVFDFESPANTGIVNNYLGYGAHEVRFYSIRKNKLPFPLRKWQEQRILNSTTKM